MEDEEQGGEQLPWLCRYRLVLKGLGLTSYATGGLPVALLRLAALVGTLPASGLWLLVVGYWLLNVELWNRGIAESMELVSGIGCFHIGNIEARQQFHSRRQSVSSDFGSRRNGTMPMKVMPLRSVQGFS